MKEPISEVFNCDCLQYMRTLPDKYFELAICDPPYGDALGSEEITPPDVRYNRFGGRFDKYKPQTAPPHTTAEIQPLRGGVQPIQETATTSTAATSSGTRKYPPRVNHVWGGGSSGTRPTRIHTSGGRTQRYYPF